MLFYKGCIIPVVCSKHIAGSKEGWKGKNACGLKGPYQGKSKR